MDLFSKPHGSRKVVDLIHRLSHGYYLNMNPTSPIRVGDYGSVDPETGTLIIDGNIYTDFDAPGTFGIALEETRDPEEKLVLISENGVRRDTISTVESDEGGGQKLTLRFTVEFPAERPPERSTALALIRPRSSEIPRPGKLAKLVANKGLLNKVVVDQVQLCPAYALVIASSTGGNVDVNFVGHFHSHKVDAQVAEMDGRWEISIPGGYERSASLPTAKCHVLYKLKLITRRGIRTGHRGNDEPPKALFNMFHTHQDIPDDLDIVPDDVPDTEALRDYSVPWGVLTSDGEPEYVDELDEWALAEVAAFEAQARAAGAIL